ncbi:MAG: hypothetical protein QXL15_00355 [Candidatus Korarchaeota archaeon]
MSLKEPVAFIRIADIKSRMTSDGTVAIGGLHHHKVCFYGSVSKSEKMENASVLEIKDETGSLKVYYTTLFPPGNKVMVYGQPSVDGEFYADIVREITPLEEKALNVLISRFYKYSLEEEKDMEKEFEEFEKSDLEEELEKELEKTGVEQKSQIQELSDKEIVDICQRIVKFLWRVGNVISIEEIKKELKFGKDEEEILNQVLMRMKDDKIIKIEGGKVILI